MEQKPSFFKVPKEALYISLLALGLLSLLTFIYLNQKKAATLPFSPPPTYVQTLPISYDEVQKNYLSYGRVKAQDLVNLKIEVFGKVQPLPSKLIEGAHFKKDELLFEVDSRDYQALEKQHFANYQQALSELKLEKGRQKVAQLEWELLEKDLLGVSINKNLALRKPQLTSLQAKVNGAKSLFEKAKREVKKCFVKAPYDGYVLKCHLQPNTFLPPGAIALEYMASQGYYVEATLTRPQLQEVLRAKNSLPEYLISLDESPLKARFLHPLPQLHPQSKLPKVLLYISVQQQDLSQHQLLLDRYLTLHFPALPLKNVLKIPREAIREGNKVWIKNTEEQLEIRSFTPLYQDFEAVYVREGFSEGEELIVSNLSLALEGMKVKTFIQEPKTT